jgi:hypothetical protein
MIVDKTSWHTRLYFWWHKAKYPNWPYPHWPEPTSVNLCPYVRTVLFWAPLRFVFLGKVLRWFSWSALGLLLQYLLCLMGYKALAVEATIVLALVAMMAVVGSMAGLSWLHDGVYGTFSFPIKSFVLVLKGRLQAAHDKVCPVIELK